MVPSKIPAPSPRRFGWRPALWFVAVLVLALPALAMQFTREVNWGAEDFLAAAVLIGGAVLAIELAVRCLRTPLQRGVAAGLVLLAFVLIWAELAVGLLR